LLLAALPAELERLSIGVDPAYAARARRAVGSDDLDLRPAEDVIPAVLQGMLRELPGHAEGLGRAIAALAGSADQVALGDARRIAHTLKGDANTVGVRGLAHLTHALEDILGELERRPDHWPVMVTSLLEEASDSVAAMADHLLGRGPVPLGAAELLQRVYAVADALERDEPLPEFVDAAPERPAAAPVATAPGVGEMPVDVSEESIALPRSVLDRLLRLSAESMALANQLRSAMGRLEGNRAELLGELTQLRQASQQLDEQVSYRGAALADRRRSTGDVDPLELDQYNELYVVSRRVQETWADARSRFTELEQSDTLLEALVQRKLRIDEDLQSVVRRSRLVPIREHRARFDRAVRQAARMLGKSVMLTIDGDDLAIDKLLLDALIEPLMHLLRNAVDHGIEAADVREAAGKPAHGQLRLQFRQRAQTLDIELGDDGQGLDLPRIAERGTRLGLLADGNHDPELLKSLLFRAGFTTRDSVTQVSGRGVGLDVVARRIQAQGGSVRVDFEPGAGTCFTLRLPLSLGTLQVGLVQAHAHSYGLATDSFAGFHSLPAAALRVGEHGWEAQLGEEWLPAIDLGTLLRQRPLLMAGRSAIGALVDGLDGGPRLVLMGAVEGLALVVLEPLANYLPPIRGVRGASVLGDGRVAPVLDLRELWRAYQGEGYVEEAGQVDERPPLVIVADDSLTIRRALGDLLIDAGYAVETARDGLEALLLCEQQAPVALLVDLEMPRMNGLELTAHLRKDPRFTRLPIVMITSRSAEKHLQMALQAGVSEVLGKPYSDDDVLRTLSLWTAAG
jgi:chemosensory pili system protein ChpA (sensor histidine kinase/response regulator)